MLFSIFRNAGSLSAVDSRQWKNQQFYCWRFNAFTLSVSRDL
jgi:hypothetical protein